MYLTIKQASEWATSYLGKEVTTSNISYLIQYGRISTIEKNGFTRVHTEELKEFYNKSDLKKEEYLKKKLGDDLNWTLSFNQLKESDTTKHVHRLHPYKGKFIPQLVEYFLDDHIDTFKKERFFAPGDIVLDPFCGSGTTLVQANELGIHSVGVDVSLFNALISNVKISSFDLQELNEVGKSITKSLKQFLQSKNNIAFEKELLEELKKYNAKHFPSPDFKRKVYLKEIDEMSYGKNKEQDFLPIYNSLVSKYAIKLKQKTSDTFLDKWFIQEVRYEIDHLQAEIENVNSESIKNVLRIVLSRTVRSCRATTHSDLATLLEPVISPYYCKKHGKICKPLFSTLTWWNRYLNDTIKRLAEFNTLKTDTYQICLTGDSRNIDIVSELQKYNLALSELVDTRKIDGIFSSPPYVGVIDYHEQHAYSYDLFNLERNDELEIGPLYKGQGLAAQDSYINGLAAVLKNSKKYLKDDYNVFLVANDKNNLYPRIAELAGMKIVNQYKRPVLNRVEKDRNAYSEIVFHLKKK